MFLILTVLLTNGNTYKKNLDYIGKSFHLDEIIRVELMRKRHKSIYCTSVLFLIFESCLFFWSSNNGFGLFISKASSLNLKSTFF